MDATTFLISRLQKLLSVPEIDWAEAECITRSFGVMVQWLDSYSLCYCRLVLWLPGGKTNLKFYATARCQAGHHKQCVNLRKTRVLLRYWDLFPANPNLNPKGKAQFILQCCTANGKSLATSRDLSRGLVSFRKWCFFLKEGERSEMQWQKVFKSFVAGPRQDWQGVAFVSGNQLRYPLNMCVRGHDVLPRNEWVQHMRQSRGMIFIQHWQRDFFSFWTSGCSFIAFWLHSKMHSAGQS